MSVERADIIAVIRDAKTTQNPDLLRDDVALREQGLDSLDVFNIILLVQEKYKIEIPDADIDSLKTIQSLVEYLRKRSV